MIPYLYAIMAVLAVAFSIVLSLILDVLQRDRHIEEKVRSVDGRPLAPLPARKGTSSDLLHLADAGQLRQRTRTHV